MLAKLKLELLKRGHSQDWLARQLGKSATWISRRVRGRVRVRAKERRQIADALRLPPSTIFPSVRRPHERSSFRNFSSKGAS
jgi:transcriptional regulator with XRE-family HTH domain